MGKLITYVLFLSVTLSLLHFAGLLGNTPLSILLNLILNPIEIQNTQFWTIINAAILLGGSGIVIGSFIYGKTGIVVKATIALFFVMVGFDLLAVFNLVKQVSVVVASVIISPLLITYILAVVEWWNSHD